MNETKEHLHPAAPEAEGAPAEPKSEPSAEAAPEPAAEPVGEPAAQPSAAATTEENGDTEGTAQAAEPSGNGTEQKQEKEKKEKKRKKPRRKGWFITPLILLCILIAGIVGCMMNIAYCQSHFEVNFYQVESVRVASPIRIVVLSDVHLSEFGQDNDDLVHAAKSLHPDLIISAGDMVSYGKSEYGSMLTLSRRLSEIAPFYGVMGNHEDEKTFLEHDETMREKFAAAGMKQLINTCEKLKIKNTDIELVGVSGGKDEYDQYGGKKTMLDAILQSYFTVYTEKHVEEQLEVNPSSGLLEKGYDFYECIYILENDTNEMLNHLKAKRDKYPDYRSSVTGYSYSDLCDIYKEFTDYVIPSLYAKVIDGPQVIDGDILRKKLTNQIKELQRTEKTNSERRDYLHKIITNYSDKNKAMLEYHYSKDGKGTETDYILKQVEDNHERGDVEIVYDKLINEYVSLDKSIRKSQIDRKHKEYLLSVFGAIGSGGSGTEEQHKELSDLINSYEKKLYDYYDTVSKTSREFNNVLSANYLKMHASVTVSQSINTKMYVAIAFAFFLVAGIVLAIIFGRAGDFAKYMLYTDKKTGLANREQIDIFIENLSKEILPDNYACIYLLYSSLFDHTKKYGYKVADKILKDFAGLVNAMGDENCFIGYNGAGRFVLFTPQCNAKRADTIIEVFGKQVEEYNNINPDYKMEYKAVYAITSDEGNYEVRGILRAAMKKI